MIFTKIFDFFNFLLLQFVVVTAPDRADAPTSKDYFNKQTNFLHITKIIVLNIGALHHMFSWKAQIKTTIFFHSKACEFSFRIFYNKYKALIVKTYVSSHLRDC